jgi:hypothetical protein
MLYTYNKKYTEKITIFENHLIEKEKNLGTLDFAKIENLSKANWKKKKIIKNLSRKKIRS